MEPAVPPQKARHVSLLNIWTVHLDRKVSPSIHMAHPRVGSHHSQRTKRTVRDSHSGISSNTWRPLSSLHLPSSTTATTRTKTSTQQSREPTLFLEWYNKIVKSKKPRNGKSTKSQNPVFLSINIYISSRIICISFWLGVCVWLFFIWCRNWLFGNSHFMSWTLICCGRGLLLSLSGWFRTRNCCRAGASSNWAGPFLYQNPKFNDIFWEL